MIKNILKNKIKESIKSNETFAKFLKTNYKTLSVEDIIIKEIEDFILSKEEIYQFSNFRNLFYDVILNFNPSRLANFLRNIITDNPNKDRTYGHVLNDIESKLHESYDIPEQYIKMSRRELDVICDKLLMTEKYNELNNVRNFIKDNFKVHCFDSYIKENRDLAIKILKSKGVDETDKTYIRLRQLLEKNPNYLGIFTYFNMIEKIPYITLKRLYERLVKDDDILRLLPEPTVNYMRHKLPYKTEDGRTYTSHFERLTDDLTKIEEMHQAKLFADEYPSQLRRGLINNSDFVECIKDLINDEKSEEKLQLYNRFFLKKVSRYKTQKELIDGLITFVYSLNDDENFRKTIHNTSYANIVFDDGDMIVARVRSQEALKTIASDTSWCIKDSLNYWMDYVGDDNIQLVLIDLKEPKTSLYRKIGITLNPDYYGDGYNFNTAHLKNDQFINEVELNERLSKYQISLYDLYEIARNLGNNEYYSSQDVTDDRYGRW